MIQKDHHNQILILDVRYQCEYNLGHLYGAVLMPYDQLQANISKFQAYRNQVIIVYCKTGVRSAIASEILVNNSFTHVYNMVGGIFAWINAGYQIYTTEHYATVSVADGEVLTHIEPLLLQQTGPPPCTQGNTCSSSSTGGNITNFQYTVLEQDENHTVFRVTFELNGTAFEFTVARNLLWSYKEDTHGYNRSASFTSVEIAGQNCPTSSESIILHMYEQLYILGYQAQCASYNSTVVTVLRPLNSETYNSSFTIMNYAPAGKSKIISTEFVEFNSSVTLSQTYAVLGKVAKEIGKVYEKSGDETLIRLAEGYFTMGEEAKGLSKLVNKQLQEYNREILQSSALILDSSCVDACSIACGIIGTAVILAVCTFFCGANPLCIPFCGILAGGSWGVACAILCPAACNENLCAPGVGCGGVCGTACGYAASRVEPPWGWLFAIIGCPIACTFICSYVCP